MQEVRVIGNDGEQLGIIPVDEAIRIAQESGLDLVEVAPSAEPPVARILAYGKFKFQKSTDTCRSIDPARFCAKSK